MTLIVVARIPQLDVPASSKVTGLNRNCVQVNGNLLELADPVSYELVKELNDIGIKEGQGITRPSALAFPRPALTLECLRKTYL
jgi:hypothetical protein